ncbi:branched-chain-amino-acid transaminase [Candidatus Roizmanbacteria bacterium RIFCSPHIGHO2_12_FULL_41_11]|uniref:Branched-chain-amino-acid aminotransferase n=2 Tax=Candidatus Roizmaniibacteriota TaxID=1752723 RepID=A0A1F7J6B2_9BACT|nr:MAG: branched-chain-amino-acid transaminase [Candidatus Roizmanbacteria bacterium RIFCSPHIGHO2_12_FULL_41_11]OGK51160.1 MAG: branched-chain-amino-acid transaminase [Candidatus Roizmanbacteria bacterium RIFCSPLOWO2_01_FULL_41_22]
MAHTSQPFPFAFFNDKIVQTKEAQVSIMTNALQYGTGVFGGIRGYYNKEKGFLSIFRPDDHFRRFLSSLKIIGVSIDYSYEQLLKITRDLVKKNKPQTDTYFRPFAYAGSLHISPNLQSDNVFKYAQYMIPLGDYLPTDKGNSVMVSSWRRVSDNAIPSRAKISGSYINSALAKKEAQQNGYEEAILLNEEGHVAEGSAMNLFMVRDGVLITPSRSDDILEGITRRSIIQLARDMQIPVEERTIDRSELYVADEMFFSGTGAQVAWIDKIDQRMVGDSRRGTITARLQEMFFKVVRGKVKKYDHWCTKIVDSS